MAKTQTSLIYGKFDYGIPLNFFLNYFQDFTTILNHENMAITQITAYDSLMNMSVVEVYLYSDIIMNQVFFSFSHYFIKVPKHGDIPKSTHLNFYDQNLGVVIQEKTCVIRHPELSHKLTEHMATTIGK